MSEPRVPPHVQNALRDTRRSAVSVAEMCDAVLVGRPTDATNAMSRLPAALRLLQRRVQAALEVLAQEGQP
jgi:hypothetical protein